ncbi:MAG: hypothetical protein Q8M16_05855 [Pirellulaceae bacterium]|nr:hypothetical protein [Pirellulaceae bacterium]
MKCNSPCLRLLWIWLVGLVVLAPATGCKLFQSREKLTPVPVVFTNTPQVGDLFTTVNRRTQNVRQLQAETTVGISGVPAKLSGSLIVERPNRLRLKVSPLGMDSLGADIGSNEQQFWVWVKSGGVMADSMLMFANHQEYAQSQVATVMPLEPRWITDALGLITFESNGQYQGPITRPDGRLEIRAQEPTARGMMASTMVFDPKTGLLKQKAMYDAQGQMIGYCDIGEYQYFPEVDAAVPTSMTLHFRPGTDLASTATIQLSNIRLNGLYVDPNTAWSMPNPVGIQRVDLSRTPITPLPMQSAVSTKQVSHTAENESYLPFRGKWLTR